MTDYGKRLMLIRKSAGLSQHQVGTAMGYAPKSARSKVCQIERGHVVPRIVTVERFLMSCGASWADLDTEKR